MNTESSASARRSDLDALRAVAMLLGIGLHAALSFFPSAWMVSDTRQNAAFGIAVSAIHGFRMPLFFVMCGYFSAMLLHRRGRAALVKHRFRRVFLPMLLGLVTVVPATFWISGIAMSSASPKTAGARPAEKKDDLWAAAEAGDLASIERHLANGAAVEGKDPERGLSPLLRASLAGRAEAVALLIQRGANPNGLSEDGGTPLHAAAFVAHEKVVEALVKNGANVNALDDKKQTPLFIASIDDGTTRYYASMLEIKLDEKDLGKRKAAIAKYLRDHGGTAGEQAGITDLLMQIPLFSHLWFLWFLWWLVIGLATVSAIGARLPKLAIPAWLVVSPLRYVWLVPLTMISQWFMGNGGATPLFGPDTSQGLLPIPHVFAYYATFFGFGAIDFACDDGTNRIGKRWWLPLAIALLVVFPVGMSLAGLWPGLLDLLARLWPGLPDLSLSPMPKRVLSVFLQSTYPWLMTFGLMGLFRKICQVESPTIRYLSDSAYWLYLAHLPLVIGAQYVVRDWPIPALAKFVLIVTVVTAILLVMYQILVRHTWLGRFLNGPRPS